ncbi:MAG: hypothetical protein CM15mP115_22980 [Alphaproteobacteria bacterium]|nr:MAG: hypothetical protein CM15mP115_22980 [Alphaproteobacteria bacterium]
MGSVIQAGPTGCRTTVIEDMVRQAYNNARKIDGLLGREGPLCEHAMPMRRPVRTCLTIWYPSRWQKNLNPGEADSD